VFLITCPLRPIPKERLIALRFILHVKAVIPAEAAVPALERSLEMYSLEAQRAEAAAAAAVPALVLTTQKPTVLQAVHHPVPVVVAAATAAEAMLQEEETKVSI
jgi:hypothetical protein